MKAGRPTSLLLGKIDYKQLTKVNPEAARLVQCPRNNHTICHSVLDTESTVRTFWISAFAGMTRVALLLSLFRDTTLAVLEYLRTNGHNISQAASVFGISRPVV